MSLPSLVRFYNPQHGARVGVILDDTVYDVTSEIPTITAFLRASVGQVTEAVNRLISLAQTLPAVGRPSQFDSSPSSLLPHWLPPVDEQDIWAAGVTYERSRAARQEESADGGDIYLRVYDAERPELFFKAHGSRTIGPFAGVGIRQDATWSVPEPELAVVINPAMEVVGFTVGNDMSSRDIEGANPLYLPQAKVYKASCALGPGIVLDPAPVWPDTTIRLSIRRAEQTVFSGEVHTSRIRRTLAELVDYLGRSSEFPDGVVLLTGTGIVPPSDFTLLADDVVEITIDGIGSLINPVRVV